MSALSRLTGIVGVIGLVGFFARGWMLGGTDSVGTALALTSSAALFLYSWLDRQPRESSVTSRAFLYGSGSSLIVATAAVVAVLLQLLAERYDHTWDLTRAQAFTLSTHTRAVLDGLDEEVKVYGLFRESSPEARTFRDLARQYAEASPRMRVEAVDPLRSPLLAEELGARAEEGGLIVLRRGDREERIHADFTEERLTGAIVRLNAGEDHRICWSVGHGEPDPDDDSDPRGASALVLALEAENHQVTLTSVLTGRVDPACEALVIFRPLVDWLPFEREALAAYVAGGGQALLLLEPGVAPDLAGDLARYGIDSEDAIVLDGDADHQLAGMDDPAFLVVAPRDFAAHPILAGLPGALVMGIARPVAAAPEAEGVRVVELLHTSMSAWTAPDAIAAQEPPPLVLGRQSLMAVATVTDPSALDVVPSTASALEELRARVARVVEPILGPLGDDPERVLPTEGLDRALTELSYELGAPLDDPARPIHTVGELLAAAEATLRWRAALTGGSLQDADVAVEPRPGGRMVVIGDADIGSNQLFALGNDRDLLLATVAWLVGEEDQLGARPETPGDRLELTALDQSLLCLVIALLIPGATAGFAVLTLVRRRRL